MGARPLYYALGIESVGVNKFEQILSAGGMNVIVKKNRRKTTDGLRWKNDVNLIKGMSICDINKVIVGDITYLPVNGEFYYISALKDAYSKRVVGLCGSDNLKTTATARCLKQAIRLRGAKVLKGCIHHSDPGVQYKSREYRAAGKYFRWSIADNCLENGMAEQLNFILKDHYLENETIRDAKDLNRILRHVKKMINEKRPVAQLNYLTPVEFEEFIKDVPLEDRPKFTFKDPDKKQGKGL